MPDWVVTMRRNLNPATNPTSTVDNWVSPFKQWRLLEAKALERDFKYFPTRRDEKVLPRFTPIYLHRRQKTSRRHRTSTGINASRYETRPQYRVGAGGEVWVLRDLAKQAGRWGDKLMDHALQMETVPPDDPDKRGNCHDIKLPRINTKQKWACSVKFDPAWYILEGVVMLPV